MCKVVFIYLKKIREKMYQFAFSFIYLTKKNSLHFRWLFFRCGTQASTSTTADILSSWLVCTRRNSWRKLTRRASRSRGSSAGSICPGISLAEYQRITLAHIDHFEVVVSILNIKEVSKVLIDWEFQYSGTSLILLNGETCKIYKVPITG